MNRVNLIFVLLFLLFSFHTILAQKVPRPRIKTPKKNPINLKRHYDDALKKGSDVSYKYTLKNTVKLQTTRNVNVAKIAKPQLHSTSISQQSVQLSNKVTTNQANVSARQSAQKAIDKWNYNIAKKELKSNPVNPRRKIAGDGAFGKDGTEKKYRDAEKVSRWTNSEPQNLTKVSSSKHGNKEAHGVVDNKSKKLVDVKPKNVRDEKATKNQTQKQEAKFRENVNTLRNNKKQ